MGQSPAFNVAAMGRILNPAGTPVWAGLHPGFADAITDNGAGDYTVTLEDALDATESAVELNVAEAQAANLQITKAAVRPSDTTIRITMVQESGGGGGASAAYDGGVEIVVQSMRSTRQDNRIECIASGLIAFAVAGTPNWAQVSGFAAAIADNGVGDASVTLDGGGADATESAIIVTPAELQAASLGIEVGVVHTSDTVKQITCTQEQAGGGASIRYDGVWHIAVYRARAV